MPRYCKRLSRIQILLPFSSVSTSSSCLPLLYLSIYLSLSTNYSLFDYLYIYIYISIIYIYILIMFTSKQLQFLALKEIWIELQFTKQKKWKLSSLVTKKKKKFIQLRYNKTWIQSYLVIQKLLSIYIEIFK